MSSAEVTPTSSTTCTTGTAAVAREDMREARLPEAAGADDRDHARAGHQRPQPLEVALAPDERARVVSHAAADRLVERQQVLMGALQLLARIGAEPFAHVLPVALEPLERRGGSTDDRLAAQEIGEQRLVVGPLGLRRFERRQRVGVRAGSAQCLRQDHVSGRDVGRGRLADVVQRPGVVCRGGRRPAVGHLQRLARKRDRRRGIAFERGRGLANERRQPGAVDLGRSDAEPIADAVADDRIRPARAAGARHEHLQALRRVGRRFLAPHELDQLLGPHGTAAAGRQRRQQGPRTVADHRPSSPADVLEQTQRDFHAGQSKSPSQTKRAHR